jgi:hypothetical protein
MAERGTAVALYGDEGKELTVNAFWGVVAVSLGNVRGFYAVPNVTWA